MAINSEEQQQALVAWLSRATWADNLDTECTATTVLFEGGSEVCTTHCARIFMSGGFALKIKRAVDYSYLHMSQIEQRRLLCERELQINQTVLPDVYIKVMPITQSRTGQFAVNGEGDVVEWALLMRRFDQRCILDSIAKEGELTNDIAHAMGQALARYHESLPVHKVEDGSDRITEVVEELVHELQLLNNVFPAGTIENFATLNRNALRDQAALLDARGRQGFVKRCHGDLHLRNLLLKDNVPTPFDALEFDERMATTDTLYDLAFLLMDLEHRDLRAQENIVLNDYFRLSSIEDLEGLALLPLFLSLRSGIRAMTTAQASRLDSSKRGPLERDAIRYLEQSVACHVDDNTSIVAIGGLSGTGKSSLATRLCMHVGPAPGAVLVRSDVERKRNLGLPEVATLPPSHYTSENAQINQRHIHARVRAIAGAGHSVIVDATFLDPNDRASIEALAESLEASFFGVWLTASTDTLKQRIEQRCDDASDATVSVLEKQLRADTGRLDWSTIDAGGSQCNTLNLVLQALDSQKASPAELIGAIEP